MDDRDVRAAVLAILDRQAILDCLLRYARGLDRRDAELLRSVFHPDATDHHGIGKEYHPAAEALLEDWKGRDDERAFSQHVLLNSSIDLDGDLAHVETYFQLLFDLAPLEVGGPPRLRLSGGRYVDRFERRDRQWRIARRVVVSEYTGVMDRIDLPYHRVWADRDATDPSYARPLEGPPAR